MTRTIIEAGVEREMTTEECLKEDIKTLELSVTERRMREAVLGVDGGWLKSVNDQIADLRSKLV